MLNLIIQFVICICVCNGEIMFPKDLSTSLVFPPKHRRSGTGLPDGHLRPLGWQKVPEGKVKEYEKVLDANTFWKEHVNPKIPLTYRKGFKQRAEIFTDWSDEFLKETYGEILVDVTTKHPGDIIEPEVMKLKRFLNRYNLEDWYLVSVVPNNMTHGLPVVESLLCGSFKNSIQEAELWMSSGGTSSKLHYDADHNLHCVVDGRKDVILYDPKYKDRFNFEEDEHLGSGHSKIDTEQVNMFQHAKIGKTPWKWTTLWPGDCVFIPSGHLHQVRSYGRSVSFTALWTPMKTFNGTNCEDAIEEDEELFTTFVELYTVWKLNDDGKRVVNLENFTSDGEILRHHLKSLIRDEEKLKRERFFKYFEHVQNEESRDRKQTPHAAFRQMDLKKKNYMTLRDIEKLSSTLLLRVARNYIRPGDEDVQSVVKDEL